MSELSPSLVFFAALAAAVVVFFRDAVALSVSRPGRRFTRVHSWERPLHAAKIAAAAAWVVVAGATHLDRPLVSAAAPSLAARLAWIGAGMGVAGLALACWAKAALGSSFAARLAVHEAHALVRRGPYRLVRHPMYTGALLALWGFVLVTDTLASLLTWGVAFSVILYLHSVAEETLLLERFGPEYARYREEVPRLLPLRAPRRGGARRSAASALPVVLLLAAAPAAASGPDVRPAGAAEGRALVYAAGLGIDLVNPNLRGAGWNEATALLYSRLYRVGLTGKIEPDLVEREEIAPDGMTWTLVLREGVRRHDGAPFGATDVKATLDAIFDPNAPCDLDLNLPMVSSVEYPGGPRVVFRLKHPSPLLPVPLSEIAILPAAAAAGAAGAAPAGTGPYRLLSKEAGGDLVFARHEPFHLGKPPIETIVLRYIPDDARRAEALAAGAVHVAHVKPQHAAALKGRPDLRVVRMATGAWRGMPLNLRRPVLQDVRVRQAIDLALDRKAIAEEALAGGGSPAYQPLPPSSWAFAPEMDHPYRDVERAKALLEEAGWKAGPDGLRRRAAPAGGAPAAGDPLTLRIIIWKDETFRRTAAEVIRRQLLAVGIRVELVLVDNAGYVRLAENMGDDHDAFIGGWGALLDPGDNLYKKFHSRGSQNAMGFGHPVVDMMLQEARAAPEPAIAAPLYQRVLRRLRDEAVFLPLAYPDYLFGARAEVAGIEPAVVDSWYEFTRNAHLWRWAE